MKDKIKQNDDKNYLCPKCNEVLIEAGPEEIDTDYGRVLVFRYVCEVCDWDSENFDWVTIILDALDEFEAG